jgi:hypothetical protein
MDDKKKDENLPGMLRRTIGRAPNPLRHLLNGE